MGQCSRCHLLLPASAFSVNRSRRDGLQTNCRECQRAYVREHYAKRTDYYLSKAKRSNRKLREFWWELLAELKAIACADCGVIYPTWVMQFDHVRGIKAFELSACQTLDREVVLAEVAKCEVVCSNCHAQRTHMRRKGRGDPGTDASATALRGVF